YPIALFNWTIENPSDRPITLSILLSWQNMVGWFTNTLKSPDVKMRDDGSPVYEYQPRIRESAGNLNRLLKAGDRIGCVLDGSFETAAEGDGQWAIAAQAANAELFYHTRWNPAGDGSDLWQT
ncbi:GH116 family glycosyl-hydrolase, partial [Vogesella mureinivorans]